MSQYYELPNFSTLTAREFLQSNQRLTTWVFTVYLSDEFQAPGADTAAVILVDRWPLGVVPSSVEDRLLAPPSIGETLGERLTGTTARNLATLKIASTNTSKFIKGIFDSWKMKRYTLEICGVYNTGMATQQTILFEDRLLLSDGFVLDTESSDDSYSVILDDGAGIFEEDLLFTINSSLESFVSDFDFTSAGAEATSNENSLVTVTRGTASSNAQTIEIEALDGIVNADIALSYASGVAVTTAQLFSETTASRVDSPAGYYVSMSGTGRTRTITLGSPAAMTGATWRFAGVDVETIANYSKAPSSINSTDNSSHKDYVFEGLNGATTITFDVTFVSSSVSLGVNSADSQKRALFTAISSLVIWPISTSTTKALPTSISFSPAATTTQALASGVGSYSFRGVDDTSIDLSATFVNAGSSNLVVTAEDNWVEIANDTSGLRISLTYLKTDGDEESNDFSPFAHGSEVFNATPKLIRDKEYTFGKQAQTFVSVESEGVAIPSVADEAALAVNESAGTLSYLHVLEMDASLVISNKIKVSGTPKEITGTFSCFDGGTLSAGVTNLLPTSLTAVFADSQLAAKEVSIYNASQSTKGEALNKLLGNLDCYGYREAGNYYVSERKNWSGANAIVLTEADFENGSVRILQQLQPITKITAFYERNYTLQPDTAGKTTKGRRANKTGGVSDSAATHREVDTNYRYLGNAQQVLDKVDLYGRRQRPITANLLAGRWKFRRGDIVGISLEGLPSDGELHINNVEELESISKTKISGVYYYGQ